MKWHESAKQEHFSGTSRWPWVVALLAITAGGVFVVTRGGPEEPEAVSDPLELVALDETEAEGTEIPPLPSRRQTDGMIRELLGEIFPVSNVRDLARRFVSAVNQIADGENPRAQLTPLAPKDAFRVRERNGELAIDELGYRRYDAVADMVDSLDATHVAAVYRQLEPVLDRTHEELGARDRTFRATLALAIDHLVQVPVPEGPIRVRRDRRRYAYVDPGLDGLSDAQQQLLRMGPRNARVVQSSLREIGTALGLPPAKQHARAPSPE